MTDTTTLTYGELMMLCEGHGTSKIYERHLAAMAQAQRETWEAVLNDLDALGLLHEQVTMSDEVKVFVRRIRQQAQEVKDEK